MSRKQESVQFLLLTASQMILHLSVCTAAIFTAGRSRTGLRKSGGRSVIYIIITDRNWSGYKNRSIYCSIKQRIFISFLRSEEHTSELQSRFDLVCRLLLEKKKTKS